MARRIGWNLPDRADLVLAAALSAYGQLEVWVPGAIRVSSRRASVGSWRRLRCLPRCLWRFAAVLPSSR